MNLQLWGCHQLNTLKVTRKHKIVSVREFATRTNLLDYDDKKKITNLEKITLLYSDGEFRMPWKFLKPLKGG